MPDFLKLASKIKTEFKDINLLRQACTHRSYLNENKSSGLEHNERLEFLGDAVLELVVTHFLYKKFPGRNEGELTAYRSAIVNTVSLSKAASFMGINEYLLLSKGESKDTGRARSIILADTVEAIIGAIYVDQGYDSAEKFIANFILEVIDIDEIIDKKLWLDAKSRFQEKAQEYVGFTPIYKTIKETGPDHDKIFTVSLFVGNEEVSMGSGKSKQDAEQDAAKKALIKKGWKN
jgi:ribonuclease-3